MNLRRLNYFIRIAELGSMNRAAEALRIAQPALTRQIRLLEDEIGAMLFVRTKRGMTLTEEGQQLLGEVAAPMRQIGFAFQNVRLAAGELEGMVSVGMPPSVRYALARSLIERVRMAEPNLRLRIIEAPIDTLIEDTAVGKLDIALLYGPSPDPRIIDRGMVVEDLLLVGPARASLSRDDALEFKDLIRYPLILPATRHGLMAIMDKMSYVTKASLDVVQQVDSFALVKELVIAGEGFTVLPYSAFIKEYEEGLLSYNAIDNPVLTRQIATSASAACRAPHVTARLDVLIQQEIVALNAAGRWPGKLLVNPHKDERKRSSNAVLKPVTA